MFHLAPRRKLRLEIIPMVDVIMFLLVFFMLFSSLKTSSAGLSINLPKAVTGTTQSPSEVTVTVGREGGTYLNNVKLDSSTLQKRVQEILAKRPDTLVIIRGDKQAPYDYIVKAIDNVREVGASRLALAVDLTR
ncbi:MAG: biopolymer transporter ExbD [Firmicutes bacterium]|nr:biopolymer transporter ExbD [Bacillota bacterium]